MLPQGQEITRRLEGRSELELLREENARLVEINREAFNYIRTKVNTLLEIIGTKSLRPEALDDRSLIEFDPIGIVSETFQHILENLQQTNRKLHFAHDEIQNAQSALLQSLSETQEANAKIYGILSSAADGIIVTDAANKVVLINRRAEELIGFSLDEQGSDIKIDVIPHEELVKLLLQAPQMDQETFSEDLTFQPLGHLPCVCQARITVINSSENEFNGCITLLHDVTEQREIDRMKDEFVSTAAHELRTPLATIIGYADLLTMDHDFSSEQQAEYLQHILKKAERLGDIVSNLLDISRIESGEGLQFNLKPLRLDRLCEDVVRNFRLQTSDHTLALDFEPSSIADVNVDRYAMTQILENLISNAIKYSPEGGEIRISSRLENGMCLLSISDQGIGMTFDQVLRIYDKFYRADASNTAISGTGLGMTIVKHLVEAQAGKVNLKSSPGKGTIVTIALPLASASSVSTDE